MAKSKKAVSEEKCGDVFVDADGNEYRCGLPAGHCSRPNQKHRGDGDFIGVSWTAGGKEAAAKLRAKRLAEGNE